jgi:hypothetical protein
MPTYTTRTITGKPDGYHYSEPRTATARTPRHAVGRHCEDIDRPRPNEVCVFVHKSDGDPRFDGEVFLGTLMEDGEYAYRPAVTKTALRLTTSMVELLKEVEALNPGDAASLCRLLESIEIDCSVASINEHHPASRDFNVSLNITDALDGVRMLLHLAHDLPHLDHGKIEEGGFSPLNGDQNISGRELYRDHRSLHECQTEDQREQWEAEAFTNQSIGQQLHAEGEPRTDCENLDQEHGWDAAAGTC